MLALIYLALAVYLGDLLCRRFYRFVSTFHRWAAAILVGVSLSTWFTYLAGLPFANTGEPLLWADLLFFVVASGAVFCLSKKAPKLEMIASRAAGSSMWDWITLGGLFGAVCVLLMGTLYVNKQGRLCFSTMAAGDFASQLAIAQSFALGHKFPTDYAHYVGQPSHYHFLFYFQAGNLELLGLNPAWSFDVLSVLGLTSMLALVMTLGELLFNSRVVGRLGAALVFLHSSPRHLINFLSSGHLHLSEATGFRTQVVFVNQRHLPFTIGIFLLILIFLLDRYRQRPSAAKASSDSKIALSESKTAGNRQRAAAFVFSALLLVLLPLSNSQIFIAAVVVLVFLVLAYGLWWLWKLKRAPILGPVVAIMLTACILAAGVMDLLAVYNSSWVEVNYEKEPLVKGLVFRNSVIYKRPVSSPAGVEGKDLANTAVTAFQGGRGSGKGQFDSPRGIAIDRAGNIFVADTGNGRIEKFSPNGTLVTSMEQFEAPNGIAIDRAGNIYVAEIGSKHRVQKLSPDGKFVAQWAPGLYGPRKIAIGPDDSIYVVDSGRNRIVKFSPDGQVLASWGSEGSGDGQVRGISSVAVYPINNKVYVADPLNSRIQVFDSDGKVLTKWSIPEWGQIAGFEDLAIDPDKGRLYASSAHLSAILVFDFQGNRLGTLTPTPPDKLDSPSGLALAKDKLFVLNAGSAHVSLIPLPNW